MWQFFVNLFAILTGGYTLYTIFQKPKISLYPGDAVRIVVYPDGRASAFHLMCNLVNKTIKVGTVHRLEVRVLGPQSTTCNYIWGLFYKYLPGGQEVQKESDPYPVAVPQKDSKLLFVEFQAEANQSCEWPEGKYEFKVIGWVNCKDRLQPSNLKSKIFHIHITEDIIRQLSKPDSTRPIFITVPVIEWERQHR
jgi:hypothetical protein